MPTPTLQTITPGGCVEIPKPLRQRLGVDIGDAVRVSFAYGSLVMKPAKSKKISKKDLRKAPAWLKRAHESFKRGPLGKLSDKEVGQLCEDIAEEEAAKRQAQQGVR